MSLLKPKSWADYEAERIALNLSRAELLRRAGISDTTMFKGLKAHAAWLERVAAGDLRAKRKGAPKPQLPLQSKLERQLEFEREMNKVRASADQHMKQAGLR